MTPEKIKKPYIVDELAVACLGLLIIAFLEYTALSKGIDGTVFGTSMAGIGIIIGWVFKTIYKRG